MLFHNIFPRWGRLPSAELCSTPLYQHDAPPRAPPPHVRGHALSSPGTSIEAKHGDHGQRSAMDAIAFRPSSSARAIPRVCSHSPPLRAPFYLFVRPLGHQASPPDAGRQDEEGLLLAANCFDNTLRVFHRRFHNDFPQRTSATAAASGASTSASSSLSGDTVGGIGGEAGGRGAGGAKEPSLQLMYALRGHTVKNWPIRLVGDGSVYIYL